MSVEKNTYVLEIARQADILTMSIFDPGELSSTIKHYDRVRLPLLQISRVCLEITSILNETNKKYNCGQDLSGRFKKTGRFLWDHLLTGEVKNRLRASQGKQLLLSLDEELVDIPWELLYDGESFLCLKFSLGRLVRTKQQPQAVMCRRYAGDVLKILILANPTADLNAAYSEGVHIRNQFDRRRDEVKIDFKSTDIDTVYVKKNLRDYDIVHFAGHCDYDGVDNKSGGWLLSDGKFTTQDILALGESQDLSLPGLIFSNACASAKSSLSLMDVDYQEKTYSLAAAFLFSGVRHYIGTIWQVEDPVSLAFAKEFYGHLLGGASIGESVRLSRMQLVKEYGQSAIPWAGYILYGDPNHCLFKPKIELKAAAGKIKYRVRLHKGRFLKAIAVAAVICIGVYLYMLAPFRDPTAYATFLKASRLFQKGHNSEIVLLSQDIIKRDPLFLPVYPLLASVYQRMGDRENALKYYFDYVFYSQKKNDKRGMASAYIGIGWVYHLFGEYPKAFEFYNKAISLSRENKDSLNEASGMRKLAVWYVDKEDYDKALELLTKSAEINRSNQSDRRYRYNLACDYFDLGLVFVDKEDITTAREFYKKSGAIFEKMKLKNELSDYHFNLGELFLLEKEYSKAMDSYLNGLKIDELHGNKPGIAGDYNMIGELYMEMGNLPEAEKYFLNSITISRQIKALPELAAAYYSLGLLYKARNRRSVAREYFRQAQEIYRRIDTPMYKNISREFGDLQGG